MTLDKKILAGFLACAITLMAVAIISFRNNTRYVEASNLVNHTHEVLYEFEQILLGSVNLETGARGFIVTGEDEYLEPYKNSRLTLSENINQVKELTIDNPNQQKNISTLENLIIKRLSLFEQAIDLRKTEGFESSKKLITSGRGKVIQDSIRLIIHTAKQIENRLLQERTTANEKEARDFKIYFIVLVVAIVITLIVVYLLITTNLRALQKAEREAFNKNWNLEGISDLVKKMQGNLNLYELSAIVINHLTSYLNAQTGALYIASQNQQELDLFGSHALTNDQSKIAGIKFGEGLVGQAAAEKRVLNLTAIPDDRYLETGLGRLLPKNIIVKPVIIDQEVVGAVEIGSLYPFNATQVQYLDHVSDSIAIAITSAQNREKTNQLLLETQRQAEELETQQYELKQTNEELQSKTEQLESSEVELKEQKRELEKMNVELEEKANILFEQNDELQKAKTEVEQKAKELETNSKYKTDFLANMSHELRTPLNSILILAQLLFENKTRHFGRKEIEFAKNIHKSGRDLLNLINEILDISKIEAGKMELDIEDVSIQGVVNNMTALFREVAVKKNIDFIVDYQPSNFPANIISDKQRLEQILKNLLSNAFKFTETGTVVLSISRPDGSVLFRNKTLSKQNLISFSVSDSGIGIPEDKQELVFEAFRQADGSTKRKYGGTGLGLSISKELALALGGEIHLNSKEGTGSTFTLYLPLEYDSELINLSDNRKPAINQPVPLDRNLESPSPKVGPDINKETHEGHSEKLILIIEDKKNLPTNLVDFINERGFRSITTSNAIEGVGHARHFKPDIIVLDTDLINVDGLQILKQIKIDPELRHIPVQVFSNADKRKVAMELGAYACLVKPVSTGAFKQSFDTVEKFISKKFKKLLIVEDDRLQNDAIRALIGNGDVISYSAFSGSEAMELLNQQAVDCIIVDLGLPDMSGFELLEKIKEDTSFNRIPIIVYTGKTLSKEDNVKLGKLADTVVLKTVDSHERLLDETILLLHRVQKNLSKEKQSIIRNLHNTDHALKGKLILVVDDDIRNIYSLTNALEEKGINCLTAENGKVALEVLEANPAINLILMDIMMPEMDGLEATRAIRNIERFRALPIIAVTARAMKGDREKSLSAGMSDYISKPVDIEQLLSIIRVWLYA